METKVKISSYKQLWGIFGISLALGVVFDYLFFKQMPGINFPVFVLLSLLAIFGLFKTLKVTYNPKVYWYVPLIVFFSVFVFIRDSEFMTFWNVVVTLGLVLLFLYHTLGYKIQQLSIVQYFRPFLFLPLKFVQRALNGAVQLVAGRLGFRNHETSKRVIRGIVIAAPLVLFFLVLFSSADLIFSEFLSRAFNWHINSETVFRFFEIVFVAGVFLGALLYMAENTTPHSLPLSPEEPKGHLSNVESYIVLGSLNGLFLLFLIVQFKYLFAGNSAITDFGFTFAEYARKGFWELVMVALLSFLVLWSFEKYAERKGTTSLVFRVLSIALLVQVLVVLASAFLRNAMYANAYGFTEIRFYTYVFIAWLAVVFLILAYKIVSHAQENKLAFGIVVSIIVFMAVLNFANPSAFIARKNVDRYFTTGKLDVYYLDQLSWDGVPQMIRVLKIQDPALQSEARDFFKSRLSERSYGPASWQSHHVSRTRGLNAIEEALKQ